MKRSCLGMVMANVIARGRFYIVVKKGKGRNERENDDG